MRVDVDMPVALVPLPDEDRLPVGATVVSLVTAVVEPSDWVKVVTKVLVEMGCVVDVVESGGGVVLSVGEVVVLSVGELVDVVGLLEVVGGVEVGGVLVLSVGDGVLVAGVLSDGVGVGVGVVDVFSGVEVAWFAGELVAASPVGLAAPLEAALLSARRTIWRLA